MTAYPSDETVLKLQKLHTVLFEMLCTLDDYCKQNQIKYFLVAGTLLGAVRHANFIPWDDDVDIGMTRPEYEKFIRALKNDPIPGYFLQHYTTEKNYLNIHAKLRKNNTYFEEPENKFHGNVHEGIFLDIFPFDPPPQTRISNAAKNYHLRLLSWLLASKRAHLRSTYLRSILRKILGLATKNIAASSILKTIDHVSQSQSNNPDIYVCYHLYGLNNWKKSTILRTELESLGTTRIRERFFPTPTPPESVLSRSYGDFMSLPPERDQHPKHSINFSISE